MFALDTNAVIHALKGTGGVLERLANTSPSELAVSSIVTFELEFGTLNSTDPPRRRRDLRMLLGILHILPFDESSARHAASLRLDLERAGIKIGILDLLIASTALTHNCVLVTHNVTEFSRVPGLQLEDWF